MKKIDTTQFQPTSIDYQGIETWDSNKLSLKEIAEKVNEIIEKINKLEQFTGNNLSPLKE